MAQNGVSCELLSFKRATESRVWVNEYRNGNHASSTFPDPKTLDRFEFLVFLQNHFCILFEDMTLIPL